MKKLVMAAALFLAPQFALGAQFDCSLVDDFDDWTVEVTLTEDVKQARFFDNDHWSTLDRYEFRLLESNPPQKSHRFFGVDSFNADAKLSFYFNETRLTATLVDEYPGEERRSYAMTCKPVDVVGQCYERLTRNYQQDARAMQMHIDRFDHDLEDGSHALAVVQIAASDLGCAPGSVYQRSGEKAACKEILPGNSMSKVCFVETNQGYFTVHETLPEGLMVTFSRWD